MIYIINWYLKSISLAKKNIGVYIKINCRKNAVDILVLIVDLDLVF